MHSTKTPRKDSPPTRGCALGFGPDLPCYPQLSHGTSRFEVDDGRPRGFRPPTGGSACEALRDFSSSISSFLILCSTPKNLSKAPVYLLTYFFSALHAEPFNKVHLTSDAGLRFLHHLQKTPPSTASFHSSFLPFLPCVAPFFRLFLHVPSRFFDLSRHLSHQRFIFCDCVQYDVYSITKFSSSSLEHPKIPADENLPRPSLLPSKSAWVLLLFGACSSLAQAKVPEEVTSVLMGARLTALTKPDGGVRGIATGCSLRRLVARTLAKQFMAVFEAECAPFQYALSTRAGTDCVGHMLRAATDADPRLTILSVDGIGAYDHVLRSAMLGRLLQMPGARQILPFVRLSYAQPSTYGWFDEDGQRRAVSQAEGGVH